jgi:ribosomal protein S18 acetylase RimI-like enzyme
VSDASAIKLREATPEDEAELLRMMRALAVREPGKIAFDAAAAQVALRTLFAQPELGRTWLVCDGASAIGYVVLTLGFSFEFRGRDAFIDELYIAPAYRRRGLGRMAMEFAEKRARELGVNAIHLEVDHGNDPAMELYRGIGYADHARYLMTKWLTKERA